MTTAVEFKHCNVLMVIENNSFPWDRRVLHEALALQTAGYTVTVICPQGEGPGHGTVEGINIYRYPNFGEASGKAGYLLEYSWALICTSVLSVYVWLRHGIDVIHSANPPDIFFLLAWPFKLMGKKYVYDQHDVCPELYESKFHRKGWFYRILLFLERESYRASNLVISTNESYRDIAHERGHIPSEKSAIVRNGVDITEFNRRPSRPQLKGRFSYMAVYLGVMGRQDGVDRVVRAAEYLVHTMQRRDVLFLMIGKGECWHELQTLSKELKVDDVMQFVGHISDELLLDYLSTADLCLAPDPPSRMNQLSTMTKIMEYMACQNPIVSFDLVETRRSAGDAAVYVEGENVTLFATALSELLDDPVRRERMAQVGLERSIHLVGLDRSRQSLIEAYARMLGKDLASAPGVKGPSLEARQDADKQICP